MRAFRYALAWSYGREHFHVDAVAMPDPERMLRRSATDVAYATCWLELERGTAFVPWLTILGER